MSTAHAQRHTSIIRSLREKKYRPPRINLPTAPDLTLFEVPPDSEDDVDAGEEAVYSVNSIESDRGGEDHLSSEDEDTPKNEQAAEDVHEEIEDIANTDAFSLHREGDTGFDDDSDVEEWSF
ncbi:hypothetical protein ON010_g1110 [Phytophthora cinnamomi]|nr:hypothetical protein ON010_g1110 [Phytophthora cinnamomi]